jgi:hypothetical protein
MLNAQCLEPKKQLLISLLGLATAVFVPLAAMGAAQTPETTLPNADAIAGTWVLQQVSSAAELKRLAPVLSQAMKTPHLRGFCLRVPWRSVDSDFSLLQQGLELARQNGIAYSVRFMAGRHTPPSVFDRGCRHYLTGKGGEKVPAPFMADGSPNQVFEEAYGKFVRTLADWCRQNGVRLLHLAWYGQEWAELNHGKEVRALSGYSQANWVRAHQRLIDIGLQQAGRDLAVELPLSGHGPLTDASLELAQYALKRLGPTNQSFFVQANGWGPRGDWGAPTAETEAAFDRIWKLPLCRGQQAIQPQDYDWSLLYAKLYENHSTYCEIYTPSFGMKQRDLLAQEMARFAATIREKGALLPKRPTRPTP